MSKYIVLVNLDVEIEVKAEDEEIAAEMALNLAEDMVKKANFTLEDSDVEDIREI